jgi:hypothetical protein
MMRCRCFGLVPYYFSRTLGLEALFASPWLSSATAQAAAAASAGRMAGCRALVAATDGALGQRAEVTLVQAQACERYDRYRRHRADRPPGVFSKHREHDLLLSLTRVAP